MLSSVVKDIVIDGDLGDWPGELLQVNESVGGVKGYSLVSDQVVERLGVAPRDEDVVVAVQLSGAERRRWKRIRLDLYFGESVNRSGWGEIRPDGGVALGWTNENGSTEMEVASSANKCEAVMHGGVVEVSISHDVIGRMMARGSALVNGNAAYKFTWCRVVAGGYSDAGEGSESVRLACAAYSMGAKYTEGDIWQEPQWELWPNRNLSGLGEGEGPRWYEVGGEGTDRQVEVDVLVASDELLLRARAAKYGTILPPSALIWDLSLREDRQYDVRLVCSVTAGAVRVRSLNGPSGQRVDVIVKGGVRRAAFGAIEVRIPRAVLSEVIGPSVWRRSLWSRVSIAVAGQLPFQYVGTAQVRDSSRMQGLVSELMNAREYRVPMSGIVFVSQGAFGESTHSCDWAVDLCRVEGSFAVMRWPNDPGDTDLAFREVLSPADGLVVMRPSSAEVLGERGTRDYWGDILVDSGTGWRCLFRHMIPAVVLQNEPVEVKNGDRLGFIGSSGNAGSHLHFAIEEYAMGVDTAPFVFVDVVVRLNGGRRDPWAVKVKRWFPREGLFLESVAD